MSYSSFDFPHTHMYDSDLREVLHRIVTMSKVVAELDSWKETHEEEYKQLKKLFDDVMAGDFPDSIQKAFNEWMKNNAVDIVGEMVNLVVFNITDDGYFVAYIPDSWDAIQFGTTGLDTIIPEIQPEYGHLVLSYRASTNAYN